MAFLGKRLRAPEGRRQGLGYICICFDMRTISFLFILSVTAVSAPGCFSSHEKGDDVDSEFGSAGGSNQVGGSPDSGSSEASGSGGSGDTDDERGSGGTATSGGGDVGAGGASGTGGVGGAGGTSGTGGAGGMRGTGGSGGSGGSGGTGASGPTPPATAEECKGLMGLPTYEPHCMCDNCLESWGPCLVNEGCMAIVTCVRENGCSGAECVTHPVCGFVLSSSNPAALSLAAPEAACRAEHCAGTGGEDAGTE